MAKWWITFLLLHQNWLVLIFRWLAILCPCDLSYTIWIGITYWKRWHLQILNRTMDGQVMGFCFTYADGKDFSFMFRCSCQSDFFKWAKELHNLKQNFVVSNVVVKIFWWGKIVISVAVYSEACTKASLCIAFSGSKG